MIQRIKVAAWVAAELLAKVLVAINRHTPRRRPLHHRPRRLISIIWPEVIGIMADETVPKAHQTGLVFPAESV